MQIARDLVMGIATLVAILLIIAFGAVGVLWRMSPAIELILMKNVRSLEAAEEMLAQVALAQDPQRRDAAEAAFTAALHRARHNITEHEEQENIQSIERLGRVAFRDDGEARVAVVAEIEQLAVINREAMRRADDEAKRLGVAGAWTGVILAALGLFAGTMVLRRLNHRLLTPLDELCATIEAASQGDTHRRCSPMDAPTELSQAMSKLNELLDRQSGNRG